MASVLLPMREWTSSARALAAQLRPGDELLVLCDSPDDPATADAPDPPDGATIDVVPVGDPEGCSGKAHALAVGLEHATQDRIVLTDDDVDRDADWLDTITGLADEHGAAGATPVFVGDGLRWRLLEPAMTGLGSALLCRYGGTWGGGVAFDRDRLDEARYRRDLERTVSDDALLWDCLDDVYTTPDFVNTVRVPSDAASVRDRVTRFVLTYRYWIPRGTLALLALSIAFLCLVAVAPFAAAVGVTLLARTAYGYLGVDRYTWLLAFPSAFLLPLALAASLADPTFEWGGRRYRWPARYDVTIADA